MRIVVIGSGFGGLAVAVRLQARGHEVTVIEKRDKPGGRAYMKRRRHRVVIPRGDGHRHEPTPVYPGRRQHL
jgi:phytoene dehydrogenase-like protein